MKRFIIALLAVALPIAAHAQTADPRFQGGILASAGVPSNGVNAVETLTFGGTITGGTFTLSYLGMNTQPIAWSATNATLIANINAALNALPTAGTGSFTIAAGTLTAGIGTVTATAGGNAGVMVIPVFTVPSNALTGTAPTLTVTLSTAGVQADGRKAPSGALCIGGDRKLYQNAGQPLAPNWIKVSSE